MTDWHFLKQATCIDNAAAAVGVKKGDYKALCAARPKFQEEAIKCTMKGCPADIALKVQPAAEAVCSCAAKGR